MEIQWNSERLSALIDRAGISGPGRTGYGNQLADPARLYGGEDDSGAGMLYTKTGNDYRGVNS